MEPGWKSHKLMNQDGAISQCNLKHVCLFRRNEVWRRWKRRVHERISIALGNDTAGYSKLMTKISLAAASGEGLVALDLSGNNIGRACRKIKKADMRAADERKKSLEVRSGNANVRSSKLICYRRSFGNWNYLEIGITHGEFGL